MYAVYPPPAEVPVADIAGVLGKTPSAVRYMAHKLGLTDRHAGLGRKSHGSGYGHSGKRADLDGLYVRSRWEANYARYLNLLVDKGSILRWEYEPETFWFPIKRGTRHYTPDFRVWTSETEYEWHEVKGYMDQKSRTKLNRFRIYHADENARLKLIDKVVMQELRLKVARLIPEWE